MGSIFVLAGTNGAGKSSIGGELLVAEGVGFHNPDEAARKLRAANPGLSEAEANGLAWQQGADAAGNRSASPRRKKDKPPRSRG